MDFLHVPKACTPRECCVAILDSVCRSVPSGRVGNAKDAIFRSNEHFREAVTERESQDVTELEQRLDRKLEKAERSRIGVTQLRRFLEQLLQRRSALSNYRDKCLPIIRCRVIVFLIILTSTSASNQVRKMSWPIWSMTLICP